MIYHDIWCYGHDGVQVILAKPDVKTDCDAPVNWLHINETAESTRRVCRCGMSGSGSTQRLVTLQEETTGHTEKDSSRRAVSQRSKMMKATDIWWAQAMERHSMSEGGRERYTGQQLTIGASAWWQSCCHSPLIQKSPLPRQVLKAVQS
jgi:hypothetical protein